MYIYIYLLQIRGRHIILIIYMEALWMLHVDGKHFNLLHVLNVIRLDLLYQCWLKSWSFKSSGHAVVIFQTNRVNTMVANVLVPCITMALAAII